MDDATFWHNIGSISKCSKDCYGSLVHLEVHLLGARKFCCLAAIDVSAIVLVVDDNDAHGEDATVVVMKPLRNFHPIPYNSFDLKVSTQRCLRLVRQPQGKHALA
jgi:hypothetical protein